MGKLIITGIEKKDNPQLVGGVFVVAADHQKEEPQCGEYTSGEANAPCGPRSYVALETHDDDHPLIGRGLDRNLGVGSRKDAIILQSAIETPIGRVGFSARALWKKAAPKK